MRKKAVQSHQSRIKDTKLGHPHAEPYDELAIWGGRSGLVTPKHRFASPAERPSGNHGPETTCSDAAVGPASPQGGNGEDVVMEDRWSLLMCHDVMMEDVQTHY
jgi:hypothetical protein